MAYKANFNRIDQIERDERSAIQTLNDNYTKLEKILDTLLSRDGLYPNQMQADLDMNHMKIINVESGPNDNDVVVRKDIKDLIASIERALADLNTIYEKALGALDQYNKDLILPSIEELNAKLEAFYASIENLVDKTSEQTIVAEKTFTVPIRVSTTEVIGDFTATTRWVQSILNKALGDIEAVIDAINGVGIVLPGPAVPFTITSGGMGEIDATVGFTDPYVFRLKSDASEALGQNSVVFEDIDGSQCRMGHFMSSDRYGVQTAIHNEAFEDTQNTGTDCIVCQRYVTNVGKTVNDYSMSDILLVPYTPATSKGSQAASTEHVSLKIQDNVKIHASDPVGSADKGTIWVNTAGGKVFINIGGSEWISLSCSSYTA